MDEINNFKYSVDGELKDSANQHIGYFRFYLNAKFEFLDLDKVPI